MDLVWTGSFQFNPFHILAATMPTLMELRHSVRYDMGGASLAKLVGQKSDIGGWFYCKHGENQSYSVGKP